MKENTSVAVELQHSQPSQAISNTRGRLEPGDARDGLNNPSGVCCLSLQLSAVAVTGYERKPAPSTLLPYTKLLPKHRHFKESSPCTDGLGEADGSSL